MSETYTIKPLEWENGVSDNDKAVYKPGSAYATTTTKSGTTSIVDGDGGALDQSCITVLFRANPLSPPNSPPNRIGGSTSSRCWFRRRRPAITMSMRITKTIRTKSRCRTTE